MHAEARRGHAEARRGHPVFWNRGSKWLWASMWVVGTESGSSARAAGALTCWSHQPRSLTPGFICGTVFSGGTATYVKTPKTYPLSWAGLAWDRVCHNQMTAETDPFHVVRTSVVTARVLGVLGAQCWIIPSFRYPLHGLRPAFLTVQWPQDSWTSYMGFGFYQSELAKCLRQVLQGGLWFGLGWYSMSCQLNASG